RYYRDELRAARARRFAAQLADTLYDLGITHKALALEMGVSLHTVDSWTRAVDPNVPGKPNLDHLCDLLESRKVGAGTSVAKAAGHKWEPEGGRREAGIENREAIPIPDSRLPILMSEPKPTPSNLPIQLSSFIGREQQIVQVARLLKVKETRLL